MMTDYTKIGETGNILAQQSNPRLSDGRVMLCWVKWPLIVRVGCKFGLTQRDCRILLLR